MQTAAMRGYLFILCPMLLGISSVSWAEDQPICADRPGKSSQTCTVPPGHFQFESSLVDWTLNEDAGERDTTLSLADTGYKFGLTSNSHIDIDFTTWEQVTSRAGNVHDHASGFGDVLVSYKYRATAPDAGLAVAISPFVKVPVAKRSIGNGKWEGGLVVPIQYAIPKTTLALSVTPEVDWNADSDGRSHHFGTAQVVDLSWQATKRLNLSGEVWAQWDWDPAGTTRQYSADGAVAYLLNDHVQLDAGANIGLNRATPDIEIYAGWAEQF